MRSRVDNDLVLYRFFDKHDGLLYIGKSIQVWSRFVSHRNARVFYPEAAKVTLQRGFGSHDELLDAERAAILAEQPKYNKLHKNPPGWERDPLSGRFCGGQPFDVVATFLQGIADPPLSVSSCGCPLAGVQSGDDRRSPTRHRSGPVRPEAAQRRSL